MQDIEQWLVPLLKDEPDLDEKVRQIKAKILASYRNGIEAGKRSTRAAKQPKQASGAGEGTT